MSRVPAPRRHDGGAGRSLGAASRQLLLLIVAFATVLGFAPAAHAEATSAETTRADLCRAWNTSATAPSVTLDSGAKISGAERTRTGASCNATDASVSFKAAAVDTETGAPAGTAAARVLAAVTSAAEDGQLGEGDEVFKNAFLRSFEVQVYFGYVYYRGKIEVQWTGGSKTVFQFSGNVYDFTKFRLNVWSPEGGTKLPNIGGSPLSFNGSLFYNDGKYTLDLTGKAESLTIGQGAERFSASDADLKLSLADIDGNQRLKLDVTGLLELGDKGAMATVQGTASAEFDDTGLKTLTGEGGLDVLIPAKPTSPEGSVNGYAKIAYTREPLKLAVDFTGDARIGGALVTSAKGSLDGSSATLTGKLSYSDRNAKVKGAIEGVVFFGSELAGRTIANKAGTQVPASEGDWLMKTVSGEVTAQGLVVKGAAQVGNVGASKWITANGAIDTTFTVGNTPATTLKGTGTVDWQSFGQLAVTFKGSIESGSTLIANAEGAVDGKKLALKGDVTLANPDLNIQGAVNGVLFYGADQTGQKVKNRAGADVDVTRGDFVLTAASAAIKTKGFELSGNASIARVGGDRWASGGGAVDLTYAGTNIKGNASMTWVAGEIPAVAFEGAVSNGGVKLASAKGEVDGNKLALKADGTLTVSGLSVKGAVDGVVYYGNDLSGQKVKNFAGDDVQAAKGDFYVKSASADVDADGFSLKGETAVGKAGTELWAKGGGAVDLTYGTTNLKGSATAEWKQGTTPAVTFAGTLTSGTTTVAGAEGEFDGGKIKLKGDISYTGSDLSLAGAVDGTLYYGSDLSGEKVKNRAGADVTPKKGDFVLRSAAGTVQVKGLDVAGVASISKVDGDTWATAGGSIDLTVGGTQIKGSADIAWAQGGAPVVAFEGSIKSGSTAVASASGVIDGNKIEFAGDADVSASGIAAKGAVEGVVFYGNDLSGEKIKNRAGADVTPKKGDFFIKAASGEITAQGVTAKGAVSAGKIDGALWAKGGGSVDFTFGTTNVKGSADIDYVQGAVPSVKFAGAVKTDGVELASAEGTFDGAKIALKASAQLAISGISVKGAVDGVVFYGADQTGQKVKNRAGVEVAATRGDIYLTSASADIAANGFTLKGAASLGKVGSQLWAKGGGSVDLTYGTTNLKGSATADWVQGQTPAITFAGTLTSGTTTVAGAEGTFDANKLALKGNVSYSNAGLTIAGAVDGVVYYGNDLSGEKVKNRAGADVTPAKGDFVLKAAAGNVQVKGVDLSGVASISKVAGDTWATAGGSIDITVGGTTIKGSADLAWAQGGAPVVAFEGSVKSGDANFASAEGVLDGNKVEFKADATIAASGIAAKGAVEGVVFYGSNLSGEKVKNRAGADVTPAKGDFFVKAASGEVTAKGITASGALSAGKIGTELWVKGGGAVDLSFGTTDIKGSATIDWVQGSVPAVGFAGSVKTNGVELLSAEGTLDGAKIALKAQGQLTFNGISVKGAVDGVVFYGADQTGQKVKNRAGVEVAATRGDISVTSASADIAASGFSLTGAASFGKVGNELWAKGGGSVDLTYGATNLKGSATADWVQGQVPAITFKGSVKSGNTTVANAEGAFDGNKIAFKGDASLTDPALTLGGAIDGVVFYGNDLSGEKVKNRAGADVTPAKGDYVLKTASGNVSIKGLALSGNVSLAKVAGETWATAGGSVDATYGDTKVKGTASVSWVQGQTPSVSFDGSISSGDLNVASAKGTIDGNKIDFQGNASLVTSGLSVKGAVDGVVFYGSDLTGLKIKNRAGVEVQATKGDFLVRAASGEIVSSGITASGAVSAGKVGTQLWAKGGGAIDLTVGTTNVKGSADIDWVQGSTPAVNFTGAIKSDGIELASATGTFDGSKIALKAAGQLTYNGISVKGAVDGVVFYGNDLTGQKIKNRAGVEVQAAKGDINVKSASADVAANGFSLKGEASFGRVGTEIWAKGGGSVDLTYGSTNLKGSATADWVLGQTPAITFAGTLTNGTTTVAGASGTFDAGKIALKGNASFTDPALTIGGSVDGVVYYGNDLSGEKVKNRAGADVTPAKGDYVLKSAAGNVAIKGLSLSGNVSLAKVAGETWATAGGSIDATWNGTTVKGSASVSWVQGQTPSVSFDGSVTSGGVTIASAKGSFDGNKIAFAGTAQLTSSGISAKGAIDGVLFYGSDLTGEKITNRAGAQVQATRGDFYVKSASGEIAAQGITAKGAVSLGKVGSQYWAKGGGSVDLTWNTTNVKGSADIDWYTGAVPAVTFSGAVKSGDIEVASASGTIDGKKIALKAAGQLVNSNLSLKGTVDVIVFYGDDLTGEKVTNRAGALVQATKGDIYLKGASVDIVAKGFALKGAASFGKVGSEFWAKGGGSVDVTYGASKLVGSADVDYVLGQVPAVNFAGSLTNGDQFVGNASGTVDGKKIALKGDAQFTYNGALIKGAVDGVFFYGSDLVGEKIANRAGTLVEPLKGDYNLKGASGSIETKGLSASGSIAMGNVRGDRWATGGGQVDMSFTQNGVTTRIQGQAASLADGTVTFSGSLSQGDVQVASVSGTVDGSKLTFEGQLSTPTMSGKASGVIFYGANLTGQTITNKAGTAVQAQKGDFSFQITEGRLSLKQLLATANFSVKRVGATWWVNADALIKTGDNWLSFKGEIDSAWNFNLKGAGVIPMDGYRLEFNGTALLRDNRLVLDGTVNVVTSLFSVQLTGTIEKPNMDVNQYSFTGRASFKFGGYQIANATVKLIFGEGLITSFQIKICILFVCPNGTYKLYFNGGNISKIQLDVPLIYWAQFSLAASVAAPGVPIESKITGIF